MLKTDKVKTGFYKRSSVKLRNLAVNMLLKFTIFCWSLNFILTYSLLEVLHRKYHKTQALNCKFPPLFYSNRAIRKVKAVALVFEMYSETTINI